jgi:hypothetical protein
LEDERTQAELSRLAEALERLEQRVAELEGDAAIPAEPALPLAQPSAEVPPQPKSHSVLFRRLATICFALVGALVLRVATRQGWMTPMLGAAIGLGYCAVLLMLPLVARRYSSLRPYTVVLPFCGAILSPLIVLETFHRTDALSVQVATACLAAVGSLGALLGALSNRRGLAATSLTAHLLAVAGLGLTWEDAAVRGASLVLLAAWALAIAHARSWPGLRPLILIPAGLILGTGVLVTARRTGCPPEVGIALLGCVVAAWVAVAVNNVLRARVQSNAEAAWLPVATAFAYGLAAFGAETLAAPIAGALAVVLLATAVVLAWREKVTGPFVPSVATTAAIVSALASTTLDPTGAAAAAVALVVYGVGRKTGSAFLFVVSQLLAITATAIGFGRGSLLSLPPSSLIGQLIAGVILGALLFTHARVTGGPGLGGRGTKILRRLAPLSLLCGFLVTYWTALAAAHWLVGPEGPFALAQTVILAALAVLALVLGRLLTINTLKWLGLTGIGLLAIKVVILDLFTLDGGLLLGSVLVLAFSFVAASLAFRRKKPA